MLQDPTALALWRRLSSAPPEWLLSDDGRRITAKALRLARRVAGKQEARILRNLLTVATSTT